MADKERQSIDVINFALLAFLSDGPYPAKELRTLLKWYIGTELSKTPFYRRMRGMVEAGFVSEDKLDTQGVYSLTEEGVKFCLGWAATLESLVNRVTNVLGEEV